MHVIDNITDYRCGGGNGAGHVNTDGGPVLQEEAGVGRDLPGVGERDWVGDHVHLREVGDQGDWLETGHTGGFIMTNI